MVDGVIQRKHKARQAPPRLPAAELHFRQCVNYLSEGLKDRALYEIDEAVKLEPENDRFMRQKAVIMAAMGDVDTSLAVLETAIRCAPKAYENYQLRAEVYFKQPQPDLANALTDLSHAMSLEPNDAGLYLNKATVLQAQGRLEEALDVCEAGIKVSTSDQPKVNLHTAAGSIHFSNGSYSDAEVSLGRALQLAPQTPYPRVLLSMVLMSTKQHDNVASHIAALLDHDKMDSRLRMHQFGAVYLDYAKLCKETNRCFHHECPRAADENAGKVMFCGKCQRVAYCGVECQRSDWKLHKKVCPQLKEMQSICDEANRRHEEQQGAATYEFDDEYARLARGEASSLWPGDSEDTPTDLRSEVIRFMLVAVAFLVAVFMFW